LQEPLAAAAIAVPRGVRTGKPSSSGSAKRAQIWIYFGSESPTRHLLYDGRGVAAFGGTGCRLTGGISSTRPLTEIVRLRQHESVLKNRDAVVLRTPAAAAPGRWSAAGGRSARWRRTRTSGGPPPARARPSWTRS